MVIIMTTIFFVVGCDFCRGFFLLSADLYVRLFCELSIYLAWQPLRQPFIHFSLYFDYIDICTFVVCPSVGILVSFSIPPLQMHFCQDAGFTSNVGYKIFNFFIGSNNFYILLLLSVFIIIYFSNDNNSLDR